MAKKKKTVTKKKEKKPTFPSTLYVARIQNYDYSGYGSRNYTGYAVANKAVRNHPEAVLGVYKLEKACKPKVIFECDE
jgi:hypothetical protein